MKSFVFLFVYHMIVFGSEIFYNSISVCHKVRVFWSIDILIHLSSIELSFCILIQNWRLSIGVEQKIPNYMIFIIFLFFFSGKACAVFRRVPDGRRECCVGEQGLQALHLQIHTGPTCRHLKQLLTPTPPFHHPSPNPTLCH